MSVCQSPVRAHLLSDTILINYLELPPLRGAPARGASCPAEPSLSPHRSACSAYSACSCPGSAGLLSVLTLKERAARAVLAKCGGRQRAARRNGCLWLSAPTLPPGSLAGADEALPRPARCWEHVVLAACGPGSLLALFEPPLILPCFPFLSLVFLALLEVQGSLQPPSICGIPGHLWCPPASSAAGQGEQGDRDRIL